MKICVLKGFLAKFGALASQSAKHSNKFFKAKRIKDDLCLLVANECGDALKENRNIYIYIVLDSMERDWTSEQRELFKVKLKESLRKNNRDGFADTLLKKCKEHDGPISSIDDLTKLLGKYDEESLKKILRQEIQYHKVFQARDSQEHPDIYKVNNLSVEDMSI